MQAGSIMGPTFHVSPTQLRTWFSSRMSSMYQAEVGLYGDLLALIAEGNKRVLENDEIRKELETAGELDRLSIERHGAIRVGTPNEARTLARVFRLMGLHAVGFYDLHSAAGLPIHATAFRPIDPESLSVNPFRIFFSVLRPELIASSSTRALALSALDKREIFRPRTLSLLEKGETDGGLSAADGEEFVENLLATFAWNSAAHVSKQEYEQLAAEHKLVADIASFRGVHINHLTPRSLSIDEAQAAMLARHIPAKAIIEGPPRRICSILLRQTSFHALSEPVNFLDAATGTYVAGQHTARFGEIEERGAALTLAGKQLYEQLMRAVDAPAGVDGVEGKSEEANERRQRRLQKAFEAFPDDWETIRKQGLAFFRYSVAPGHLALPSAGEDVPLDDLIANGTVRYRPIVFEDFLPASAAGIFASNLASPDSDSDSSDGEDDEGVRASMSRSAVLRGKAALEVVIDSKILDEVELYAAAERESLGAVARELGVEVVR